MLRLRRVLARILGIVAFLSVASCARRLSVQQFASVASSSQQPQLPAAANLQVPIYLPPEARNAQLIPLILYPWREPSLFEAARDASVHAFRISYLSLEPENREVARLVIGPDGTGQIVSTFLRPDFPPPFGRRTSDVSAEEVARFLQLIVKDGFWSMTAEPEEYKTQPLRRVYTFDGAVWMLEGVEGGSFHYAFRRNPEPAFRELAGYFGHLAKLPLFPGSSRVGW